jgi:hypothetical protein
VSISEKPPRQQKALGVKPDLCNKQQDTGLGMATRCMLMGRGQNGLSLSPERGHEGRIREVLQEDGCSSMYINCVGHWKSYYKRFHFDPLKCMAGFNVQCKKDWCVEI